MIRALLPVFLRHQAASIAATVVDFGVMILLVEHAHFRADGATLVGATLGAVTNFTLGRRWAFRASGEPLAPQAARYAVVSGSSAMFNALGEHSLVTAWGLPYLPSRMFVAFAVSMLWNFPAQRNFVFRRS
jgi:putative flippase GtrA